MGELFKNLAWDDFRLIKAIADVRSLPAAAALLGINHSTVFRRLGQIEEALGAKLFERHRSGYTLTTPGEEMVALAQRMDDDITAFTRKMAGREITPAGEVRVTTNDSLLIHLLTPLFVKFRKTYPDLRLDVVLANQELNLSKRDADVAIRATDSPPENLVGRRAATIAWALYGRADDFPDPQTLDPESLYDRDWVSLGDNLAMLKAVRFVREHVPPERIGYKVNTVLGLAEAVEQGLGIGHLPCFIGDARPGLVRIGPLNPDFSAGLWLLTHSDLRQSPRVRVLLDFLAAEIAPQRHLIEGL
ncbi:LysR family transcriptional regulator [Microvirga sp. 3-52]|uniref:LysR family transcriptional regulator n=1 Tax=Microvirga sp. 3-52 TaxID=2792425 RepID=UPI001AC66DEB|nr:LysR family transcriptional regulator [Microvirga sp. 3-52]MBO1904038.1 LysR family transcriptional regulator [Microvirga sp. 3-52]MBS7451649.1 LysR family transcriptional regulator [Microvirga sp. 3-52]